MYPILLTVGPITIYSYGFFLALGYLVATFIFWREGKKQGYPEEKLLDFSVLSLIAAIVGGRLFFTLLNWDLFDDNLGKIAAFWEGGFAYFGSFLSVLLMGFYLIRKWRWSFFQIADIGSLAVLAAFSLGKVGSFLSGNDFGSLTNLPWGVSLPLLEGQRHPVQLYEAIFALILLILLYRYYKLKSGRNSQFRSGAVFFYFLILSSLGRIVFEQFRADSTYLGPFRLASLLSFLLVLTAVFSLYFYQFRSFRADISQLRKLFFGLRFRRRL